MCKFHKDGTLPKEGEIFVFGSNMAGIHGAGAAKAAVNNFGARMGKPFGLSGQSFALPTKNKYLKSLPIENIKFFANAFRNIAIIHHDKQFFVTRVGCGLAGYKDEEIAPMFYDMTNVSYAEEWKGLISK